MSIVNGPITITGSAGVKPMIKYLLSTDSKATIETAGYLNEELTNIGDLSPTDLLLIRYDYVKEANTGSNAFFNVTVSGGIFTLSEDTTTSSVTFTSPSVANHIAVFSNTTGNLTDDVATAINGGSLQAGLSGTAGTLASFPATALKGSLKVTAVANTGDTLVTVSNAAHAQASVYSIPDGGQATSEFIIADSAGIQHITSGSLQVDAGNLTAGISGAAGTVSSFPTTALKGSLKLAAVANTGDTVTTISNAAMGQASTISIIDPGAATANFILSASSASTQSIGTGLSITGANNVQTTGGGNFLAGASGSDGIFVSYPATAAKGSLILAAVDNTGNTDVTISNSLHGQATVVSIPDSGAATAKFVLSQSNAPTNKVTFTKVITIGFASLSAAALVSVQANTSATSQFAIHDIKVLNSTGLSGGGGDRLLKLSDATINFNGSGITAALLGTPVFTVWGGTGNPVASGTSQVSTAGAAISFSYTGGTTDFTAGSIQLLVTMTQVTL